MRLDEVQTMKMDDPASERLVKRYIHYYQALMQESTEMSNELRQMYPSKKTNLIMDFQRETPQDWEKIEFKHNNKTYEDLRERLMIAGSMIDPVSGMYIWKKASNYDELHRICNAIRKTMQLLYGEEQQ